MKQHDKMRNLTAHQLTEAAKKHDYIVVRHWSGVKVGVNCRFVLTKSMQYKARNNPETRFMSYYPCSFMEYISLKEPFIL